MSKEYDFDLFVIGAGSGGVRAGRMAAAKGKKVAIAEVSDLGGTCVNVGCVPKKLFVYASQFPELFHASQGYGWNIQQSQSFNWQTLRDNKTQEIRRLNGIYQNLLSNSGAQIIKGRASLESPNQVSVNGHTYSAENILIATGGWPYIPEFEGSDLAISSNEMFTLEQLPEKAVVVGGGYIAFEFAGILNGLGVKTDLIYRGDRLLKSFDPQCSEKVTEGMIAKGVNIHLNTEVRSISGQENKLTVHLNNHQSLEAGIALYATGRTANTQGLGLKNTKIKTQSNGAIVVDDYFKTAEPNIYALGDVIDRVQLTPVAIQESMLLLEQLYGESKPRMDYENIPTAVFSQPELATVGLTEQQARDKYSNIKVYESDFRPMFETLGQGKGRVYIKLIVDSATDRVVGCHMVGEHAAEIIQGIAIAIKAGATKTNFDQTMGIHPTVAEELVTLR
ncbi:MAG: glutathione-disulfide reductase [Cellvibrionales bacterium]|nr:glutathione-disulfide reductase [Cellvibrionales bacterium]